MTAAARSQARALAAPRRRIDALLPSDDLTTTPLSPRKLAWERLKTNRIAWVALAVFALQMGMIFSAGWFESAWAGRTAQQQNLSGSIELGGKRREVVDLRGIPAVGPGVRRSYTFGADPLGRDVFMRVLRGGAVSLVVAFGAATLTILIGTTLGLMAGYHGGRVDTIISSLFDVLLSFPSLVFGIALSAALAAGGGFWIFQRGSLWMPLLIIGVVGGPYFGRIVRAQVVSLGSQEFVEASRASGASSKRVMAREILPHLTTTIITYAGLLISSGIIAEAGFSFLGIGVLPPTPSWGNMIADGQIFYSTAWWIAFFPGLMILITVLSLNLIGQALEEAFDPKALGGR